MTWLFVMTSPSDVMILTVPSSSFPFDFTSMDTTAGMTLLTSSGMVTLPLRTAAPGAVLLSWMVTLDPLLSLLLSDRAVTPAPMPPPTRAATITTGSQVRILPCLPRLEPGGVDPGYVASPDGGYENGTATGVTAVVGPLSVAAGGGAPDAGGGGGGGGLAGGGAKAGGLGWASSPASGGGAVSPAPTRSSGGPSATGSAGGAASSGVPA